MTAPTAPGRATLRRIVELACRAPSVRNTQPWLWQLTGTRIDLYSDDRRQLPVADGHGRNLTLSCGAALHHATVVARALGFETRVHRMPDPDDRNHLAAIDLIAGRPSSTAASGLRALERRCTDRGRFTSWPMSDERLSALSQTTSDRAVHVIPITDISERVRLELSLSRAAVRQASDSRYADERSRWTDRSPVDGIPTATARASAGSPLRPSRFTHRGTVDGDELVESSDGLLLLGTDEDDRLAWLQAGEALSALWLRATVEGLSVVPISQVIEVDETRLAVQHDLLRGRMCPQTLIRIGWQEIGRSDRQRTPRRPLDDVLIP